MRSLAIKRSSNRECLEGMARHSHRVVRFHIPRHPSVELRFLINILDQLDLRFCAWQPKLSFLLWCRARRSDDSSDGIAVAKCVSKSLHDYNAKSFAAGGVISKRVRRELRDADE